MVFDLRKLNISILVSSQLLCNAYHFLYHCLTGKSGKKLIFCSLILKLLFSKLIINTQKLNILHHFVLAVVPGSGVLSMAVLSEMQS